MITGNDLDDWTVIAFPADLSEQITDNTDGDYEFNITTGLAGTDLTTFTEYCYEIIEEEEVTYTAHEVGCPAYILKYYDGFAFGVQFNYYSDD